MKSIFLMIAFAACMFTLKPAYAWQSDQQAADDASQIAATYDKYRTNEYRQLLDKSFFGSEYEEKVAGFREHLRQLSSFEQNDLPQIDKAIELISSRYGRDEQSIRQAFQAINNNGGSIAGDPAYAWAQLKGIVDSAGSSRKKIADKLNQLGSTGGQTAQGYDRMSAEESFDRAKTYLELALQFQPDHEKAKSALAKIDGEKNDQLVADKEAIDNAEFPPHAATFQGNPDKMAKSAFDYLKTRNIGLEGKLLKVRIAGDWKPHDTLLNVTVNWGLPVEAAYQLDSDSKTADVVSMKLISQNENPEPPFQRFVITGSRKMRVKNVAGVSTGGKSGFLRFPLSICLIALGLIAVSPLLRQKVPGLENVIQKVLPYAALIGVVTLVVGAAALAFNLLSPFRDLFPQVGAIVLGLAMGMDLLIKQKPGQSNPHDAITTNPPEGSTPPQESALEKATDVAGRAFDKAQDLLIENQEQIRKLDKIRVPLGIGCTLLGLIHLVAGSQWLV